MHEELIKRLKTAIQIHERAFNTAEDRHLISGWRKEIGLAEDGLVDTLACSIALLGESGAGKSTLINALIGLDLLPHDTGTAVTAIVTELSWRSDDYCLEAHIKSKDEFLLYFKQACSKARAAKNDADTQEDPSAFENGVDKSERSDIELVTGMSLDKLLKTARIGDESDYILPEILSRLGHGPMIENLFMRGEEDKLRDFCWKCLCSKGVLRPIVNKVTIRGPFEVTRSGLSLVDVPGLNDPDPTRDKIAREFLQKCNLLWWVASTTRIMSDTVHNFLVESRQLLKLELEGRLASFGAVITKIDDLNPTAIRRAFGIPTNQELNLDDYLRLNKERGIELAKNAIQQAWTETIGVIDSQKEKNALLIGKQILSKLSCFGVSSSEYLRLNNLQACDDIGGKLMSLEQTGIPQLLEWIQSEFVLTEMAIQKKAALHRLNQLYKNIKCILEDRWNQKKSIKKLTTNDKGGLKDLQKNARKFLEERIGHYRTAAITEANAQANEVKQAIEIGMQDAAKTMPTELVGRLGGIHWSTLRGIARSGGKFNGSKKHWDIPSDLAAIITRKVVFEWKELFESRAKRFCQNLQSSSCDLIELHESYLNSLISHVLAGAQLSRPSKRASSESLEFEILHVMNRLSQDLQAARLRFERDLIESMRRELRPAFLVASNESGKGMKDRIVTRISNEVNAIIPSLLPALTRDLNIKVDEVTGMLRSQIAIVHNKVTEAACRSANNLELDLNPVSPEIFNKQIENLSECLQILDAA